MNEHEHPAPCSGQTVAVGEVLPPRHPAPGDTKAGSTADLKALHADLTAAYRDYLEMAKIKPSMLSPTMLGLIQQFLRHNEIIAEAPQRDEADSLQRRFAVRRAAREGTMASPRSVHLSQAQRT